MIDLTDRLMHSRRTFLGSAALAALATIPIPHVARAAEAVPASFSEFQKRLVGPIYSNPCPFTADLKLDDAGQHKGIARALKYGVGVFASTGGNTKYDVLSYDEIKQVNRVMIEAVGRRGLVIAATGDWPTEQAVDFTKYIEGVGADAVQVMRTPAMAKDDDKTFAHIQAVARATKLPLVLHGQYGDVLLQRLVAIESVAAMKEDGPVEDYVRQQIDQGHRLVIFGGGGEHRFYIGWPYGAQAYYSTYTTYAPDVPAKIWKLIQSGDIRRAAQLTAKHDYARVRRFAQRGAWHAALEIFGISTRQIRPPHKVYTDEQMNELKQFFLAQGLSPDTYAG
jgi:dihydrodipicolinate synthase/N-acetylneuraminate lyase